MTALAGHAIEVYGGTSASPTDEMDGITSISFGPSRDMLETTDFKDTTGARTRLAGLKDGSIQLSGQYESADTAQAALRTAWGSGADFYLQVLWDGTNGNEVKCIVESYEVSGDVGGLVEFTATLQFNAAPSAV